MVNVSQRNQLLKLDFMLNAPFKHSNMFAQEVHEVHKFKEGPYGERISVISAVSTAKRILERLHHRLSKFDRYVFLILKPIFIFFWRLYGLVFYLETIGS